LPYRRIRLGALLVIWSPDRDLLFPRRVTIGTVGRWFRRILDDSGIYAPKGCGMRFHRIRKSKASYTELAGGDAQRALGHSARSVTERYLDPRIVGRAKQPAMPRPTENRSDRGRRLARPAPAVALVAEHQMNRLLKGSERAKGAADGGPGPGRGKKKTQCHQGTAFSAQPTLEELGITKKESSAAQKLASLPHVATLRAPATQMPIERQWSTGR